MGNAHLFFARVYYSEVFLAVVRSPLKLMFIYFYTYFMFVFVLQSYLASTLGMLVAYLTFVR